MRVMTAGREPGGERVGWGDLARWLAPWLLGALLALAALLGLFAASRAPDDGAYALGFATAGLALVALAWLVKRACDGRPLAAPPVLVEDATALAILEALLAALAVFGLLLAAHAGDATVEATGYALFGFGLVFAFWNLKHYFDVREQRPPD